MHINTCKKVDTSCALIRTTRKNSLPVRAMTTASLPVSKTGRLLRWTGVGVRYPSFLMPPKTGGERLRDWKPPPEPEAEPPPPPGLDLAEAMIDARLTLWTLAWARAKVGAR